MILPPFLMKRQSPGFAPPRSWIKSTTRSVHYKSIHRARNKRFKTLPAADQVLFHHPHRAVARMVDDLAGDTAEEEFFASRKPLSANHNGAALCLV
jgi:hypothetical protein